MSCTCMADLEKQIVERQLFDKIKVTAAKFDRGLIFEGNQVTAKPILEVELTIEGRKSNVRKSVIYNYCPFCGKPYEEKPAENKTENDLQP